jgi:hypothetical protein
MAKVETCRLRRRGNGMKFVWQYKEYGLKGRLLAHFHAGWSQKRRFRAATVAVAFDVPRSDR